MRMTAMRPSAKRERVGMRLRQKEAWTRVRARDVLSPHYSLFTFQLEKVVTFCGGREESMRTYGKRSWMCVREKADLSFPAAEFGGDRLL